MIGPDLLKSRWGAGFEPKFTLLKMPPRCGCWQGLLLEGKGPGLLLEEEGDSGELVSPSRPVP